MYDLWPVCLCVCRRLSDLTTVGSVKPRWDG